MRMFIKWYVRFLGLYSYHFITFFFFRFSLLCLSIHSVLSENMRHFSKEREINHEEIRDKI